MTSPFAVVHASNELLAVMAGAIPLTPGCPMAAEHAIPNWRERACGASNGYEVFACMGFAEDTRADEVVKFVVDCPACLALMREARGGVRDDALQERESAAKSVLVNAEFDAERAAKSEAA